jgi:hypothetical protein
MMPVSYESELRRSGKIIITVKGVSMRPLFRADSDAIIVKKCPVKDLKNLDIVLFIRPSPNGIQYVLHRIVGRNKDGCFIIAGDNCVSADIVPPKNILGVAAAAQRSGKPIKLSGLRYRMYEKLWCKPYKFRFFVLRVRNKAKRVAKKIIGRG